MLSSDAPLTATYDVALLDLDGVVYVGAQAVPGVPQALARVRDAGMRLAFVTNNASRTPDAVAALLVDLGVPATPRDVITSSHAAAHYLADRLPAGAPVLVLGTHGLIEAVKERGLTPVFSADDAPRAVVQGYSPELNWHNLAEGMVAIRAGARWVATNLDPTVPSPRGPLPGNGSLVAALRHATGVTPEATGKPDPTMHVESVQRSGAMHPIVVGDRLDTDIEGARRADCASLLVLTGVTDARELLAAAPLHRPDFLGVDVSALLDTHRAPLRDGAGWRSGHFAVTLADGALTLRTLPGPAVGDEVDPLRVLAVAAWCVGDEVGRPVTVVRAADANAENAVHRFGLD